MTIRAKTNDMRGWNPSRIDEWIARVGNIEIAYLLKSGFWLNLNTGINLLLAFGLSIVFANFLSKEVYGTYQYLLSILAFLSAFTLSGMNSAITRSAALGYDGVLRAAVRPQLLWNLIPAVLGLGISTYYLLQGDMRLGLGMLAVACAIPVLATFNTYGAFLIGKKSFRLYFFYSTTANVLYYVGMTLAVLLFPAALPIIFANLALTSFTAWFMHRKVARALPKDAPTDPDLVRYGKHLSVQNGFGTMANQVDSLLVFQLLGPVQLAIYSIATLIPERLGGFLKNLTTSTLPRFTEQTGPEIRRHLAHTALLFFVGISTIIALYCLILPNLFALVYPQYLEAVPYSQVFSLTLVIAVGNMIGMVLLAHRRIRRLYTVNTVMPILQVTLQAIGIIGWGLWGLVWARVLGSALFIVATSILVWSGPLTTHEKL